MLPAVLLAGKALSLHLSFSCCTPNRVVLLLHGHNYSTTPTPPMGSDPLLLQRLRHQRRRRGMVGVDAMFHVNISHVPNVLPSLRRRTPIPFRIDTYSSTVRSESPKVCAIALKVADGLSAIPAYTPNIFTTISSSSFFPRLLSAVLSASFALCRFTCLSSSRLPPLPTRLPLLSPWTMLLSPLATQGHASRVTVFPADNPLPAHKQ